MHLVVAASLKGRHEKLTFLPLCMSFTVTGIPTNTPSRHSDSMRARRWVGFFRVAALKGAVQILLDFLHHKST